MPMDSLSASAARAYVFDAGEKLARAPAWRKGN